MINLRSTIWAQTLHPQELVRVTISALGKPATLTGVPAGGWFGEGSLLKDEPRRYEFNRFLLNQLNERLAQFIAMLEYERLLYPGVGQKLQVSQEEIGYLSGISRQRVNQALQTLEKEGLLRVEYGGVTILDLQKLRLR